MDQHEPRAQAIRRLRRRDVAAMLVVYVVVNVFLVGVWLFSAAAGVSGRSGRSWGGVGPAFYEFGLPAGRLVPFACHPGGDARGSSRLATVTRVTLTCAASL